MATQDIIRATGVSYTATNGYSFEFKTAKNGFITEIFLLLPPESYKVVESTRSSLTKTVGGGYLKDFGNDFKNITISGSSHFFYAGNPRNTGQDFAPARGAADFINGFEEFLKLRFMVMRYRDYTLTPGGRMGRLVIPTVFGTNPGLFNALALAAKVRTYLAQQKGATYDQINMYWHSYDDDDHFKVRVVSFESSRSKDDPFTVDYNIVLEAYQIDPDRSGIARPARTIRRKSTIRDQVRKIYLYSGDQSPETAPDTLPVQIPGSLSTIGPVPTAPQTP